MTKIAVAVLMLFALLIAAPATSTAATGSALAIPINGSNSAGTATFSGIYNITGFAIQNGSLVAVGNLVGTLTNKATQTTTSVSQAVAMPVTAANGSCNILHLELGPLDLNLLGLQIHLDRVVLDITAQSGPGNLLGNLLCAVANLLNGTPTSTLTDLLNQIVAILRGV